MVRFDGRGFVFILRGDVRLFGPFFVFFPLFSVCFVFCFCFLFVFFLKLGCA